MVSPSLPTARPSRIAVRATSPALCGSTTSTSSPALASFSIVPSENFTVRTRSGFRDTTFSKLTLMPPTFSSCCAAAGSSEKSSTPTMRGPAPSAKRNSVIDGPIETIRWGRCGTVTEWFWKSMTVTGNAAARAEPLGCGVDEGASVPAGAQVAASMRSAKRAARRKRIWLTPFSRRRVGREQEDQATRVRTLVHHGCATLPDSHRLRWDPAYSVVGTRAAMRGRARSCTSPRR